jgi:acetyl esterase
MTTPNFVLDPDLEKFLALARQAGRPPFEALTPAQARSAYAASWDVLQPPAADVASVRDLRIAGPGGQLALRIYRGAGTKPGERLPGLVYLHGGGWVIGNLESHDRLCRNLANQARLCVIAVDYRLAPEHPFPAALDDSAAAWQWVVAHSDELAIERGRIGIGGDSAGGNLAAVVALMGRDGTLPRPMHQALIYPVVDLSARSDSYLRVTSGVPLTAATMHYFIDHYTPKAQDRSDWRASPLLAATLAGTPPALVVTVAHDPLCDEGRDYAARLEADGVRVTSLHLGDHMHGMLMHGKLIRASKRIVDFVAAAIGAQLYEGEPAS